MASASKDQTSLILYSSPDDTAPPLYQPPADQQSDSNQQTSPDLKPWPSLPVDEGTTYYTYIVTHYSQTHPQINGKPACPSQASILAFDSLAPAISHAKAWWSKNLEPIYGAALQYNFQVPNVMTQELYLLRSDERNFQGKTEQYLRQEVTVTRMCRTLKGTCPGCGKCPVLTVENRAELREAEMNERWEEEALWRKEAELRGMLGM